MINTFHDQISIKDSISVFTDEAFEYLIDRQIEVLGRISGDNLNGFHVNDLDSILLILQATTIKLNNGEQRFLTPICAILEIASLPFSNQGAIAQSVKSENNFIYGIICLVQNSKSEYMKITGLEAIRAYFEPLENEKKDQHINGLYQSNNGLYILADAFVQNVLDESKDSIITTSSFLMKSYLYVLINISDTVACQAIIREDVLSCLLVILSSPLNLQDEILSLTIGIIWNLLEYEIQNIKAENKDLITLKSFVNLKSLNVFTDILRKLLQNGHRKCDKGLRNDIIVIVTLLCQNIKDGTYVKDSKLLETIINYSAAPESGLEMALNTRVNNYDTSEDEDFQFKILSWKFISSVASLLPEVIKESLIIPSLLEYINERSRNQAVLKWTQQQYLSLQENALHTLFFLIPAMPDRFIQYEGRDIIINYLRSFVESPAGTKIHSEQNISGTLRLLIQIIELENFKELFADYDLIPLLLSIFENNLQSNSIRTDSILLLSSMCIQDEKNKNLFRDLGGIEALIASLDSISDSGFVGNILLAIVHSIWSCVIGNKSSEVKFFLLDGVHFLLSLLEVESDIRFIPQVLGCLADIMRNKNAHSFFKSWKSSKNLMNGVQLLIYLWQKEEKRLNVISEPNGCIKNMFAPLESISIVSTDSMQTKASDRLRQALEASKGIELVGGGYDDPLLKTALEIDLRAKIFSVFSAIGFENIDTSGLLHTENISLCLIQSYDLLCRGQEFYKVKSSLTTENVKPILADRLIIESEIEACFNEAANIKCQQCSFVATKTSEEIKMERGLTTLILGQKDNSGATASYTGKKNKERSHMEPPSPAWTEGSRTAKGNVKRELMRSPLSNSRTFTHIHT